MVQSEKRVLWHPRQENKFVVGGGSQITLYKWTPNHPGIKQVTSQHDLQYLKCFAWSPDPAFEDLIAIGNTTGKIELLRLEASKHSQRSNVLSNGQSISLVVRNSRSCNSLAFCTTDANYLASGFDKVRGDSSLIIWDVTTTAAMLSVPVVQAPDAIKRLPQQPHRQPMLPQGDVGRGSDPRVLQQHASTETVSAVSFLPQSTHLLLAGISHRWLRLFDLRSPVSSYTSVASKVQGIATDPFDPHRVACFGEGTVTVWDSRKLSTPFLTFSEKDASADGAYLRPNSAITGIEISRTRRGVLATLEKDASYVRFWDMISAQVHPLDDGTDGKSRDPSRSGRRSWANLPWPSGSSIHSLSQPLKEADVQATLVLSDTRRTKNFTRAVASFALAPSARQHPLTSNVMVVNKEGDLELYAVHDTPKQATWSARGDLAISAGQACRILDGSNDFESEDPGQWGALTPGSMYGTPVPRSGTESMTRGRPKSQGEAVVPPPPPSSSTLPPLFGRGDEDGFPALSRTGRVGSKEGDRMGFALAAGGTRKEIEPSIGRIPVGMDSRNHSASRTRRQSGAKGVSLLLENDISMVMKRRALRGYGLSQPQNNLYIVRDYDPPHESTQLLADLWAWIYHSHEYLSVPKSVIHGFDFAYQGLLGIWEGFPPLPAAQQPDPGPYLDTPPYPPPYDRRNGSRYPLTSQDEVLGNFQAALAALAGRRTGDRPWKPTVATAKGLQRQIALQLCGWSLREEELASALQRWEQDGELSRAACWLVFTKQYSKAISLLLKSSDESHRIMSGTIAALVPHSSGPRSTELREHCERLIVGLDDPYFRVMLTHLALNDWSEVLEEELLPFRERLAIAFQFLDDKAVTAYLRRCMDRSSARGHIDGIIVPGLASTIGMDILQGYVDRTGDIQTAAILGSYVCPPRNNGRTSGVERRVARWVEGYRDLLDGFKMFHYRVGFDIERGQVAFGEGGLALGGSAGYGIVGDWVPKQILIRCNYCNKPVSPDGLMSGGMGADIGGVQQSGRPTACYHCNRSLPRCSICLMTLSIVQDAAREAELLHSHSKDTIDDAIVMCQTCRHGGHVSHILDWFYGEDGGPSHDVCAVADCDCRCAEEI
ncbi:SEH-associated protein 4 [Hypsizygus marmoreus]|uniref:SEH-associated protein 4 n=1 Tax=Hypsizygus marmoreus TaxID=39966 RepID=A0A369JBK8_HYPMA|nr:SEH-associated protein 4 [Hypsizygus marmoreus]